LYVVPERRDRGLGTALIAAVRTECRRRRVEQIEINVDIGDTDAQRFYERHGFTAIEPDTGEHALWYHGPVD
jgi:GNAT superfamily N-acetyltransferase